jgi:cytochrome o ubiquinol oxidase subunit 2
MTCKSLVPRSVRRLAVAAAPLLLGGCKMVVMNPTGDIALQERNLILIALGMMLLVIVPVMSLTVIFALRYRKGRNPKRYDPNFHHSTRIEVVVWSIPLLIITCLGAITWSSTHKLDPFRPLDRIAAGKPIPQGVKPLEVQVVALDWKWLFIYPEQGIATVNALELPVDVPVHFSITSTSQMNTFSAPTLAGMIYAMPGMKSQLNAVLNKPGDSWGYSGNYTGRGYSDMRFQVHGVDQATFDRWIAKVKAAHGDLSNQRYLILETPSEKTPVTYFSSVAPGLFDRVVNRCVAPGTACAADVMQIDRAKDHDNGGMFAMPAGKPGDPMPMDHALMSKAAGSALHNAP